MYKYNNIQQEGKTCKKKGQLTNDILSPDEHMQSNCKPTMIYLLINVDMIVEDDAKSWKELSSGESTS